MVMNFEHGCYCSEIPLIWSGLPTMFKNANTQILISLPDAQLRISQGVLDFASGRLVNLTKTNTNYFAAV